MLTRLKHLLRLSFERSPNENLKRLGEKLHHLGSDWASYAGGKTNQVLPDQKQQPEIQKRKANQVLPDLEQQPVYQTLIASRLSVSSQPLLLLGSKKEIDGLTSAFTSRGHTVMGIEWDGKKEVDLGDTPRSRIIICRCPLSDDEWRAVKRLKLRYGKRVIGIQELALPFTLIEFALGHMNYFLKSLEALAPYYLGEQYFGPLQKLDEVWPLAGKNVIEFGPFDGCQTAGLVHLGVKSVTCIEARAENAIKTMIAGYSQGWNHVRVIMDDFHNVDRTTHGIFDLAFAHGVYYHSIAPFHFMENLLSLSDAIFLGGFCATDQLPSGDYELLPYCGKTYRAKKHVESDGYTSGVNLFGYYFNKDDLMEFFRDQGCEVTVISEQESTITAGIYLRFLARKTPVP
jgi:hypothetical protein